MTSPSREAPRRPKLGERVAAAIGQDIAGLGWPVGRNLGGEAELMKRYGVSRATLREAIRQVEHHGLALMCRGVRGGLVVQAPARSAAVAALSTYLQLIGVRADELFEARELIELQAIRWAVARCRPGDIAALKRCLHEYDHAGGFADEVKAHLALCAAIADCGHNSVQLLPMEALAAVTIDSFPWHQLPELDPAVARALQRGWHETAEAVATRDLYRAEASVRERLRLSRRAMEQRLADTGRPSAPAPALSSAGASRRIYKKIGHRLPQIICRDLAHRVEGERLGSEAQLQQRLGISRASLREAVRMLELHGLVRTLRGQNGGFVVGRPDPAYTVELAALYLRHTRPPAQHCFEVWRGLIAWATERCAERLAPQNRQVLEAALAERRCALAQGQAPQPWSALMQAIAAGCGNRAIDLFARVFGALSQAYVPGEPPREWLDEIRRLQIAAGEAILAQDAFRARRHIEALLDSAAGRLEERAGVQDGPAA